MTSVVLPLHPHPKHTHIHTHTCRHTCMHTHAGRHTCMPIHTNSHKNTHAHTHTCMHTQIHKHTHAHIQPPPPLPSHMHRNASVQTINLKEQRQNIRTADNVSLRLKWEPFQSLDVYNSYSQDKVPWHVCSHHLCPGSNTCFNPQEQVLQASRLAGTNRRELVSF